MNAVEVRVAGAGYGGLTIVSEVDFRVESGRAVAILGANGAGKSTTLRAIMGTVRCSGRRLAMDGEDLGRLPPWDLPAHGVVFVPDGARCFPNLSVWENVSGAFHAMVPRGQRARMAEALDKVYTLFPVLRARSGQLAGTLSGGERQMLSIGRALMSNPRLLILDEPSAGLAPKLVEELYDTLALIKRTSGCALVVAEQNVPMAARVSDDCALLEQGHVVLSGPMTEVIRDPRLHSAYLGI